MNEAVGAGTHVLVVDDIKVNVTIVETILKKQGFHVDTAINGQEALNKVKNQYYDIILMDCHMPEMDGYTATEAIRDHENAENKKRSVIIAITADVMEGHREKCLAVGMDDYINKPVRKAQLLEMLQKWL